MNYVELDSNGFVIQVYSYTDAQYATLAPDQQAAIMGCGDLGVTIGYQLTATGWVSVEELLDNQFAADPVAYQTQKIAECEAFFQGLLTSPGFQYSDGNWYKADQNAQIWALGYMFTLQMGIAQYPVNWIQISQNITSFANQATFGAFISYFFGWLQKTIFANYQTKMQIRAATTRADVDTIYTTFINLNHGTYVAPSS